MLQNFNYLIKGMERLFEEDFNKSKEQYIAIYLCLFKFLSDVKHVSIQTCFEDALILFARYYLHYIPSIKTDKLLELSDN